MVAFFAYFHYNMPELLSNKNSFSVLLGVGLISAGIIAAKMQDKCENTIDKRENTIDKCENTIDKSKFDKDQITKIAAVIFITIYFIVAPIFAGIGSGVIFSLKFDINDLLIIIFSELIPLIVIAITGMSLKIAIEMMIAVFGKKGEDEKSK